MNASERLLVRIALGLLGMSCVLAANRPALAASLQNTNYVNQVYKDLGIIPPPAIADALVAQWAQDLDNGLSHHTFVHSVVHDARFRQLVITQCYEQYLDRSPHGTLNITTGLYAGGEYGLWQNWWNTTQGTSMQLFYYGLAVSPEYYNRVCSSDNATFIRHLYVDMLGRGGYSQISQSEVDGWLNFMAGRNDDTTRTQVVEGFVTSYEFRKKWVDKLYENFLRRAADPAGEANWVSWLANGSALEDIIVEFLSSDEYYNHGPYETPVAPDWSDCGGIVDET